jgi:hypothetical protein
MILSQWSPAVILFFTFFTFFYLFLAKKVVPDSRITESKFLQGPFLYILSRLSGLAGQPASPDLDPVPDVLKFRPDFLYIPMYSRELTSLPGNGMIWQKRVTPRDLWAQWPRPWDDHVLCRDCLCVIDNAHPPLLLLSVSHCFVIVFAVAVLIVFVVVWHHRCRRHRRRSVLSTESVESMMWHLSETLMFSVQTGAITKTARRTAEQNLMDSRNNKSAGAWGWAGNSDHQKWDCWTGNFDSAIFCFGEENIIPTKKMKCAKPA